MVGGFVDMSNFISQLCKVVVLRENQHRIVPPLDPNAPPTPPRREPAITLVPLDGGLGIRKSAAAQTGDVLTGQESAGTPPQRLINNPPSGSLSVGNLRGGRVTVLGVTEETILPGTTKGP